MGNQKDDIFALDKKTPEQFIIEVLTKNPNAAVADPRLRKRISKDFFGNTEKRES